MKKTLLFVVLAATLGLGAVSCNHNAPGPNNPNDPNDPTRPPPPFSMGPDYPFSPLNPMPMAKPSAKPDAGADAVPVLD